MSVIDVQLPAREVPLATIELWPDALACFPMWRTKEQPYEERIYLPEERLKELEEQNAKLRKLMRIMAYCMQDSKECDKCALNGADTELEIDPLFACDGLLHVAVPEMLVASLWHWYSIVNRAEQRIAA